MMRNCSNSQCNEQADVYAGGQYSDDWADYYCHDHIPTGYKIWDKMTRKDDNDS